MSGPKERAEAVRQSWPYRVIERTRGNQSMLGAVMQAIIGRAADNPPTAGMTAIIDTHGIVRTNLIGRDRRAYVGVPLGTVADFTRNLRILADDLKLSDADRIAMFEQARKWISHDYRAITAVTPGEFDPRGNLKEV